MSKTGSIFLVLLCLFLGADAAFGADCPVSPGPNPDAVAHCNGDVNGDGVISLADTIYLLNYQFANGDAPVPIQCSPCDSCCETPSKITVDLPGNVPLEMVSIASGTFMMGAHADEPGSFDSEKPRHQVTLTDGFYLGKYEVTKRQWEAVMGTTPWIGLVQEYVNHDPDSPAVYVCWNDAQAFIEKLNEMGQGTFRLPSEAEWEYACRAGTDTYFYWGDDPLLLDMDDYAWWSNNAWSVGEQYEHRVGLKKPNAWGLYDMTGNVREWCHDVYDESYYSRSPDANPAGPSVQTENDPHVIRGGCMYDKGDANRSARRFMLWADNGTNIPGYGFRIARSLK